MNRLVFWSLVLACVAVEIPGLVIDRPDVHYTGIIAAVGLISANLILAPRNGEAEGGRR
ncbi:hypothetical protein ABZ572_10855 [Streptomyces sp. NPDC018338]|uniref:hypothetical protein n=1 Tax=Streptomyces sp. NPDC018338 TaxID=3157192 RepID=UPI0033F4550E